MTPDDAARDAADADGPPNGALVDVFARSRETSPETSLVLETARKAIHVASSAIPIAYAAGLPRPVLLAAFAVLGAVAAATEYLRRRHAPFAAGFARTLGPLLRAHERVALTGATWMLVAYALAVVLFPRDVAVTAMLAVALGDAAAAIVGRAAGTYRARRARARGGAAPQGKTLAGSVACLVATAVGALLVARIGPGAALAAGTAAALAEWPTWRLDDNIRVCLAAGLAVLAWRAVGGG